MVKTVKEMRDKALALQGDYLRAYEDVEEMMKCFVAQRKETLDAIGNESEYVDGRMDELALLLKFFGIDELL